MRYLLATFLLASVYAGCNGGAAPVSIPTGPSVALGQEFTLGPGQSVSLAEGALSVRFERVTEDSRCPQGVNCVWEGDAVVAIVASRAGASGQHQLHTSGRFARQATEGPYRIELLKLEPVPAEGTQVPPSQYAATLRVVRE
jgi:hypothetical protein